MGKVEVTYTDKQKLLENTKEITEKVLSLFQMMRKGIEDDWGTFEGLLEEVDLREYGLSPGLGKNIEEVIRQGIEVEEHLAQVYVTINDEEVDISTKELRAFRNSMMEVVAKFVSLVEETKGKYRITTTETPEGEVKRVMEFKSDNPSPMSQSPISALEELKKISQFARGTQTQIPKDLIESQIRRPEESLLDSIPENEKEKLLKLQSKGKLLFGSMDGLSDGTAYFKAFSLVLSQILNEQSKYYNTEGDWSGVPTETISTLMGGEIQIQKRDPVKIGKDSRPHPYVWVSYEELAKRMSKTGSISGGKDIEQVRQYIEEIGDKRYPVRVGAGQFIILPYLVNEGDLIDINKSNPYVGCILRLSPQFSRTTRGYVGLPSDIIQRLGGGKQKGLTMDLLETLAYNRGVAKEWKVNKRNLLSKYADTPNYRGRPGKLQKDFMESVVKIINTKLLLTGTDKKGNLNGYRESKNNGGEIISHFYFNPDFLQGEDIGIPEEQTGE